MISPSPLPGGVVLRPLEVDDAEALLDAYLRNRDHLGPTEPVRPDSWWTLAEHRERLKTMVQERRAGRELQCAMFRDDRLVGGATLKTVVLGALQSADLGYWVDEKEVGRGLASAAVAVLTRFAEQDMGLHRVAASTNVDNQASQRVLAKNGFVHYGTATNYLYINGRWSDSKLFQRILHDRAPGDPADFTGWREVHP
jgi:ribosomal-protein-alanine N-acetyltransferase